MHVRSAIGLLVCLLFLGGCVHYGYYHPARQGYGDYYYREPAAARAPAYRTCVYFGSGYVPYYGPYAYPYYETAAARCAFGYTYSSYYYALSPFSFYLRFGSHYGYPAQDWRNGIWLRSQPGYRYDRDRYDRDRYDRDRYDRDRDDRDRDDRDRERDDRDRRPAPRPTPPVAAPPAASIPSVRYAPGAAPVDMPRRVDTDKVRRKPPAQPSPRTREEQRWQTPPHRVEPSPPDAYAPPARTRTPATRSAPQAQPSRPSPSTQTRPGKAPVSESGHVPGRTRGDKESRSNSQNDKSNRENED